MNLNLKNKTAVISGGGSGIGLSTAKLLVKENVNVILLDKNIKKIDKGEFKNSKLVTVKKVDITHPSELSKIHKDLINNKQKVNIIINCAGITGPQGNFKDISLDKWKNTLDINLLGPVNLTKEFLSDLNGKNWGRVIFLASEDALQPYEEEIPYCSSKAGILALSKGLSRTLGKKGILVNSVSPAFIKSPMTDRMMINRSKSLNISFNEAISSFLKENRPFMTSDRRGKVSEVANVIVFLCSDKASFVNGANYKVDAGSVATI